jgi:hypothetical protein
VGHCHAHEELSQYALTHVGALLGQEVHAGGGAAQDQVQLVRLHIREVPVEHPGSAVESVLQPDGHEVVTGHFHTQLLLCSQRA